MVQRIETGKQQQNILLKLNLEDEGFLEVSLFDTNGDLVYNYSDFVKGGMLNHKVECNGLKSKQYLLRIAKNGKSEVKKLLIH